MKKPNPLSLLLVDDHHIVRTGLAGSINVEPDLHVVAEAATGELAIELYAQHRPDVVLMDLRLPGISGIEAIRAICANHRDARVIALSTYDGDEDIYRALQAGARSYLLKNIVRSELIAAIRAVHAGDRYIVPDIAQRIAERVSYHELSARELEVLRAVAGGRSNKEIAAALYIAEVTVKLHVSSILAKLKVNDRTQAVTKALQRGILHL